MPKPKPEVVKAPLKVDPCGYLPYLEVAGLRIEIDNCKALSVSVDASTFGQTISEIDATFYAIGYPNG